MSQTVYQQNPDRAFPGMPADSGFKDDIGVVVEEALGIEPGLLVVRGTGGAKTARLPPAVLADPDSLKLSVASVAAPVSYTGAAFDGTIGQGRIEPPAKIDLVFDSNGDWDATDVTVKFKDENGVEQTEVIALADAGNVTLTTALFASFILQVDLEAQSGTGGFLTIGTSSSVTLEGGNVLGFSVRTHKDRRDFSANDNENYEDEDEMPVRREGRLYVVVENAFSAGDRPLVRVVAAGNEKLGAVRVGDTDGGDCVAFSRGELVSSGGAGALGILELNL